MPDPVPQRHPGDGPPPGGPTPGPTVEAGRTPVRPVAATTLATEIGDPQVPATLPAVPAGVSPPGYEILGLLGRGGMGVVYQALQVSLNRVVALKMVGAGAEASREELARFRAEAEAVARLQHPHIVQIFEIGEHEGRPYFALEYVGGGTLARRLDGTPLPPREAAALAQTLARAVHSAHGARVIHRDLKPANILLPEGADGLPDAARPKIADFGLAKLLDNADRTHDGAVMGTPSYMAPEQAEGRSRDIGPATDVYALGAILYECLTGRPPFRAADVRETIRQVLLDDPVAPRELQPGVPRDLETVCLKCLRKDAAGRYPGADELADDLGRFLGDEPVRAWRTGTFYRARKFARRNKALVGGTVAVLLTLAAGLIGTALGLAEARTAEREARRLLAESYAQAAELAARRGAWREALENNDRALAAGHPGSVDLRLAKVRAWRALDETDAALNGLEELAADPAAREGDARAALWRADLLLLRSESRNAPEHLAGIRHALDAGLPPAEAEYARGMLAGTLPDAETHLRRALELDTFHQRARAVLTGTYLVLARYAEVRQQVAIAGALFPDDPTFPIIGSYALTLEGHPAAAAELLNSQRERLGPRRYAAARKAGAVFREGQRFLSEITRDPASASLFRVAASGAPLLMKLNGINDGLTLPLHPVLAAVAASIDQPGVELARRILAGGLTPEYTAELVRVWPEGLTYLLHGGVLGGADRWAESEAAFRRAAETPSIADVRRAALSQAAIATYFLATAEGKDRDPKARERFRATLREVSALGDPPASEASNLAMLAVKMGEHELARPLLSAWERQAPSDLEARSWRATLEFRTGAFARAVRAADQVLKQKPDHVKAREVRAASLAQLLKEAKALGPPDGNRSDP
jgi:hypothetical protein